MKKVSLIEYLAYLLARLVGAIVISLPLKANFALGRIAGITGYSLLKKKRRLVLKNLKTAFRQESVCAQLERIAKKAFISLALNIIETLYIPRIDFRYINRHVRIENLKILDEALKEGRGVILLAYHLGNWELANITCGLQGYAYKVIVNEQRYPLLNSLLNRYRESKGCKTIPRGIALREVLKALKNNEVVAMVGDQGGRDGHLSDLFAIPTPTPSGFVRFALNTGASIIPAIIVRERRLYHRIILEEPIKPDKDRNNEDNLNACLSRSNAILQSYISEYPQEYFWFYKIWKYSPRRQVVVLSDGKAGHLRQAQAVLKAVNSSQFAVHSDIIEVKFKNRLAKFLFQAAAAVGIDARELCLGRASYSAIRNACADLVISCGSALSGLNLMLAKENLARSVCIMNPGISGFKKFSLVIMPRHDRPGPGRNIVVTEGALNLIDEDYLKAQAQILTASAPLPGQRACIGLLIGGNTRKYELTEYIMRQVIREIKKASRELGADILVTTSRRTPQVIEAMLKKEFKGFQGCRLLVIANDKNIPEAVGGILGSSDFILVSGESISMVSEAASSGRNVGVFRLKRNSFSGTRHEAFLNNLEARGYLCVLETAHIADKIRDVLVNRPEARRLNDRLKVEEAIKRLL